MTKSVRPFSRESRGRGDGDGARESHGDGGALRYCFERSVSVEQQVMVGLISLGDWLLVT